MPDTHINRLKCGITSVAGSGTGTITLASAESGFRTFASGDDGKTFSCLFLEGTDWEVATGCLYTHSGTTLTRGTLEASSSGSAITLTSAGKVSVIAPASLGNKVESIAGGKTIRVFTPLDNQPPAADFATLDTRNSIAVLDFDAATDEFAVFVGHIPQTATVSSGLKVIISWAATSAISNDCVWGVQFAKLTGVDVDVGVFTWDTATTATTTTSSTLGLVNTTTITAAVGDTDGLAAGDCFAMRIYRDANAGGDTMTGDAELIAVELQQVA